MMILALLVLFVLCGLGGLIYGMWRMGRAYGAQRC